jgi:hypothetical protein
MMRSAKLVERRWQMLDDGVVPYALAALRSLWIAPWLLLAAWTVSPATRALFGLPAILALLAGGTAAAQCRAFLFKGRRGALGVALVSLAAVGGALYLSVAGELRPLAGSHWSEALVGILPRLLVTLVLAAALWWWGLTAGRERVAYDGLARNFVYGLGALLAAAALNASIAFLPSSALLAYLLAFMALGLFLLALASIQEARRYESARADHNLPLARHWWSTVAAVVAAMLLIALLISRLVALGGLDSIAGAAAALLGLAGQLVSWLFLLVSYPVFWLLASLGSLLQIDQFAFTPPEVSMMPGFTPQAGAGLQGQVALAPAVQATAGVVGAIAIAAAILLAFLLALRRFGVYIEEDVAETHESILSLGLIKAQLAQLLRRKGAGGSLPLSRTNGDVGDDPRVQVRRTYQALLAWAAGRGVERPAAMTPDRFGRLLCETYPQHGEQFAVITAAYERARYGPAAISDASAAAAAAAWRQILLATESTR